MPGRHVNALPNEPEDSSLTPPKDDPIPVKPFLGYWGGQNIGSWYQGYEQVFAQVKQLSGPYMEKFGPLEWYPKAGEGGSWQARYLHPTWGDPHPLAIDGPGAIRTMVEMGKADGVGVNPYINVRGNPAWNEGEWRQICEIMQQGVGRVILNLENGTDFWLGPTDPEGVQRYWDGLYRTADEMGVGMGDGGDRQYPEGQCVPGTGREGHHADLARQCGPGQLGMLRWGCE
jgi:hypothetical protein